MKRITTLLAIATLCYGFAQQSTRNLDFEILENDKAKDWNLFGRGDYSVTYDSSIAQSGKISACIESNNADAGFKALAFTIPANFGGKKIKLTGYLKTENVTGWAGLWMRIDPDVAFDNMQQRNIKGTNDWTKYEIELDLNNNAKNVVVGGILAGEGKIWVDNLEVTIDGHSLDNPPKKELTKAQKDTAFDNGSNISMTDLSNTSTENLEVLGRVWGFLKYHHPAVAKGNYNWDYELFRFLPTYLKATSSLQRDAALLNWIDSYGTIPNCKKCKATDADAFLKPDLKWIDDSGFSSELKEKLKFIQQNRHQGEHYYIGMMPGVGNPEFKNENPYGNMSYPDAGFRLLALYRYWNMINYYFPYKHLTDKDWNTVLKEYIPQFIDAKDELAYEKVMIRVIGDVKDTHANLWRGRDKLQEKIGKNYPPVYTRFVENQLTILDYYNADMKASVGLEVGDVITHINGKPVPQIVKAMEVYYPASNQPTRLRDIGFDILRSQNSSIDITVKRHGASFNKTLALKKQEDIKGYYRWYRAEKDGNSYKMLSNNIGYITLKNIKQEDIEKIQEAFKDTKGLIIDIRNYPSTFVPFLLGNYINPNRTEFVKFTNANINNPGEFYFGKSLEVGVKRKWNYNGKKVVVLVNEISQSQAEYTTMAFRASDKTTVIGSTTAGADGNVSNIPLPGGMSTMISGIGVYYPDGTETQRVGIVPDIEVKPTIEGIQEGRDELLEKAIEVINNSIPNTKRIKD